MRPGRSAGETLPRAGPSGHRGAMTARTAGQAEQSRGRAEAGNKAIATLVLEGLAIRGERARVERGRRALEAAGVDLVAAPLWLADDAIRTLFEAVELEPARARALGHKVLAPEATGLALYGLGLGTPEKAYRRVSTWLPRDDASARWSVERIDPQAARLVYRPAKVTSASRTEAALCALRHGMLEAVPGLYGLLPARVEESACVQRGAAACAYDLHGTTTSTRATRIATIAGGLAGWALLAVSSYPPSRIGLGAGLAAGGLLAVSALVGRVVDLTLQLSAVAGARRGHLALFDQVDDALAEKLDTLARVEAKLDATPASSPVRRESGEAEREPSEGEAREREVGAVARRIHAAAGDLEGWLEERVAGGEAVGTITEERSLVRDIREWAARIGRFRVDGGSPWRETVDPERLVRRAIAAARPLLPSTARVRLEVEAGLPALACEPVQIEHLVVQLLRNAIEASVDLSDAPEAIVRLRPSAPGLELCVEDRGVGIESSAIDEVFDPFFGERPPGEAGLGLKVCLRIVEAHDGELRFDNGSGIGTRVSVLLPTGAGPMPVGEEAS